MLAIRPDPPASSQHRPQPARPKPAPSWSIKLTMRIILPGAVRRRQRVRAMIVKEFRQLRRDRRTLAMMIVMPVLLLVILGYAASFDVSSVPTAVAGPGAGTVARALPAPLKAAASYSDAAT